MGNSDAFVREPQHLYQADLPVFQYDYWLLQETPLDRIRSGDRVFLFPLKRTYTVVNVLADGVSVLIKRKTSTLTGQKFWRAVAQTPQGVSPTSELFEVNLPQANLKKFFQIIGGASVSSKTQPMTKIVEQVWMKQIDNKDNVAGDLLRVTQAEGNLFLIFKDGSYAVYRPALDRELWPFEFTHRFPTYEQLLKVGLLTDAQYHEQMSICSREAQAQRQAEAHE